ncbi:MAG: hypothetical protein VX928_01140 [Pseudomonadota bacterium]|nr:hypothetical protein [Pseudomonadota bacterium]
MKKEENNLLFQPVGVDLFMLMKLKKLFSFKLPMAEQSFASMEGF